MRDGEPKDSLEAAKWRIKNHIPLQSWHKDALCFEEMRVGRLDPDIVKELKRQFPKLGQDSGVRRARDCEDLDLQLDDEDLDLQLYGEDPDLQLSDEDLGLPRALKYKAPARGHDVKRSHSGENRSSSIDWFPILAFLFVVLLFVGALLTKSGKARRPGGRYNEFLYSGDPPTGR